MEQNVSDEVLRILKSPEVVMKLNKLSEERKDLNKSDIMTALKNLNEAWNYLYQAEQRKIVRLLVNTVEIHENGLKLNLNLDGFDNLLIELAS
ncbi:MAG: hypothetical protein LBT90_01125 [Holosporaceae bacterium]|nr:hypothetical protein [Holosporaceae bacterium]